MPYDEDLENNSFFLSLKKENEALFLKAISEDWIICIPQQKCVSQISYSLSQVMNSFLVPVDNSGLFRTLQDVEVKYENNLLIFVDNHSSENSTAVLFRETFYDDNVKKYMVLCLEDFLLSSKDLNHYAEKKDFVEELDSYYSCVEFLWAEIGNKTTLNKIDHMINEFQIKGNVLEKVAKNVKLLFKNCWEEIILKMRIREKCQREPYYQQKLKLALETYLIHGLNHKLLPVVKTSVSHETEILNKNLMNLQDLQLKDMGIDKQFEAIINGAKVELARVEQFFTPLGKLQCLKKSVKILSERTDQLSSDELLPLLVFLIIKCRIPSWCAQLKFIALFSLSAQDHNDENSYYMATMEAAIEHVKSGAIFGSSLPESLANEQQADLNKVSSDIFEAIEGGNVGLLKKLLSEDNVDGLDDGNKFSHHPLCSCSSCTDVVGGPSRPVDSVTSSGLSPLHATAKLGKVTCLEAALTFHPDLDLPDNRGNTALHLAASAGHQNCLLLLLHAGVNYNLNNQRGDSALHLAVLHGHESCVKALLYFAEHKGVAVHVNSTNVVGDTPLHLASSWGYQGIVHLLLEYGASVWARNKKKLTPADCTENYNILQLLSKQFVEDPVGFGEPKVWYKASPEKLKVGDKSEKSSKKEKRREDKSYVKEMDRLFKAILRGDDNLACFYLNLYPDKMVAAEEVSGRESASSFLASRQDSLSVPVLSGASNACHPLCDCDKCAKEKLQCLQGGEREVKLSVNSQNKDGYTAVHLVVRTGNRKLLLLLLQRGASVNVHTVDQGQTPLHIAIGETKGEIAELLMEYGAKVNEQDKAGNTCLHYCAIQNLEDMAGLLLRNNANQEVRNFAGKTPYEEARARMNFAVKKLLYE